MNTEHFFVNPVKVYGKRDEALQALNFNAQVKFAYEGSAPLSATAEPHICHL